MTLMQQESGEEVFLEYQTLIKLPGYDYDATGIRVGDAERVCCAPKVKRGLGRDSVEQFLVLV